MAVGRRTTGSKPAPKKKSAKAKKSTTSKTSGHPDPSTLPYKFVSLPSPPGETFVDGTNGITVGRDVVKLEFYSSVGFDAEDKKEIRVISHRLVLPRSSLQELMQVLQGYSQMVHQAAQKRAEQSNAETKN
jgi:hypothetical protein